MSLRQMSEHAGRSLTKKQLYDCSIECNIAEEKIRTLSAWRVSGTLREFSRFKPINIWFKHPKHEIDDIGILSDIEIGDDKPIWKKAIDNRKKNAKEARVGRLNEFEIAFAGLEMSGPVLMADLAKEMGLSSHKQIGEWLGNGKKARKDYKERYEVYTGEDAQRYIRRKQEGTTD
jgi:hypothetical protein